MRDICSILFGAVFTVAVATALGSLLIARLRVALYRTEAALIAFVVGSGCLSFVTALLCMIHQARKGVFQWGGAVIIALAIWVARRSPKRRELPALPLRWIGGFFLVFAIFGYCYFINALAPEISPDGSGYHLGNVARMWRHHGFVWDYHSMYSYLSQGTEMLFLIAFSFGRHSSAAMVHLAFCLALPLLMVCWGRRFGFGKPAIFAAVVTFVSPIVGKDGVSAYNDLAVVTIVYAVFYLTQVWDEARSNNLLILIGLLTGAAYGAKYTAFLAFPFAAGWVWWRTAGKVRWKPLAMLAIPAALLVAPWVLRNWIWLGNPAAPFLNSIFPNPYYHAGMERMYADMLRHYIGIKHYWQIPLELTLRGGLVSGLFGPVFLLFPFALFALRLKFGRELLLAALVFAIPAYLNTGARFLIPSAPFLALAMGIGMAEIPGALPMLALFQAFLCWPSVLSVYCHPATWRLGSIPTQAAFRKDKADAFIRYWEPDYPLKVPIELQVPAREKVFTFAGRPDAYIDRDIIVSYESTLGNLINDILLSPLHYPPEHQQHMKFIPLNARAVRVVNTGASEEFWTVAEMRLFYKRRELPRAPDWRISARPNSWEVQYAFDNSYATRWSTWQRMSPGDYIEVEFPSPRMVDEISLECALTRGAQPEVDVLVAGRWVPVTDTVDTVKAGPPPGIRRAASRDVKALGIRHVLVNEHDGIYEDLHKYTAAWGMTELAVVNGVHFYRID
jgi:hypothetical protein